MHPLVNSERGHLPIKIVRSIGMFPPTPKDHMAMHIHSTVLLGAAAAMREKTDVIRMVRWKDHL